MNKFKTAVQVELNQSGKILKSEISWKLLTSLDKNLTYSTVERCSSKSQDLFCLLGIGWPPPRPINQYFFVELPKYYCSHVIQLISKKKLINAFFRGRVIDLLNFWVCFCQIAKKSFFLHVIAIFANDHFQNSKVHSLGIAIPKRSESGFCSSIQNKFNLWVIFSKVQRFCLKSEGRKSEFKSIEFNSFLYLEQIRNMDFLRFEKEAFSYTYNHIFLFIKYVLPLRIFLFTLLRKAI